MSRKPKKKDEAQKMLEYTYRDSGQEYLMRQKMLRAIVIAIILGIALTVFIALYVAETKRVQETYRAQYNKSLIAVLEDIHSYQNADGDFELRYRMLVSDMASANSFAFLLNDFTERQKSINGLYTVVIKYPEQTQKRIDEVEVIFADLTANLDKGYDEMDEFVASIDLKGF
ncbi:MAG: hypothetical protein IKN45_01945 [Lachnospiraceae bacterium]|nr:hypothetical protein [Lachnospiraceae bacterium]